ncbi:MAG: DUF6599 family protein [Terriglobales bacterium]
MALAAWAAPAQEAVPPLLPVEFSGWTKAAPSQAGTDPRLADPSAPALLREFGFTDFESSTYRREGRVFTVRAARFADASGAYGAFTHYKLPQMLYEEIGEQGASADRQVLFYKGNVLVTAMLDKVTAMSAGELRTLAAALPQLSNRESTSPPTLPTYLPKRAYIKNSARYVVGPVGLAAAQAPLPPALVDFSVSPEVVLGRYHTSSGDATLVLISYPTPQIAAEHLKSIEASALQTPPREAPQPDARPNPPAVAAKRSGPLVVVVSGDLSADEAKSLLAAVNYDAEVTWNENTFLSKRDNIGNLLMAIFTLVGFLLAFALVMGVAFGGVRILAKRMFPDKVFDRSEDVEIIQLNLRK